MPCFSITRYTQIKALAGLLPPSNFQFSEAERLFALALLESLPPPSLRHEVSAAWNDRDSLTTTEKVEANRLVENFKAKLMMPIFPQRIASDALLSPSFSLRIAPDTVYGNRIVSNYRTFTGNFTVANGEISLNSPLTLSSATPLTIPCTGDFMITGEIKTSMPSIYLLIWSGTNTLRVRVSSTGNYIYLRTANVDLSPQLPLGLNKWITFEMGRIGGMRYQKLNGVLIASDNQAVSLGGLALTIGDAGMTLRNFEFRVF